MNVAINDLQKTMERVFSLFEKEVRSIGSNFGGINISSAIGDFYSEGNELSFNIGTRDYLIKAEYMIFFNSVYFRLRSSDDKYKSQFKVTLRANDASEDVFYFRNLQNGDVLAKGIASFVLYFFQDMKKKEFELQTSFKSMSISII